MVVVVEVVVEVVVIILHVCSIWMQYQVVALLIWKEGC